ncbi:tumor necrosis factor receptor superfamily member 1B-like [Branchiostoma lanceolatum]|uniref:tumor necrosis factor receptor superfamily member 1B-like n=1 Tax=Branchiostoma lanceolatum TaxID=7740 RepID=UPI003455B629
MHVQTGRFTFFIAVFSSAMVCKTAKAFLISACLLHAFCSPAPVHEASPILQQHCDFNNWCSAGAFCDHQTSGCLPCPPRTYQGPVQYKVDRCIQHSVCTVSPLNHDDDDGRTGGVHREGNRTHDTVCECEAGKYWNETERGCREISKCPAGQGVSNIATAMFNTKCTTCTPGTFSDQLSVTQVCTPCTDCRAQRRTTVEDCTPMQDAVCGATVITQTQAADVDPSDETSPPKEGSPTLPTGDYQESDKEDAALTTTDTIRGKSPNVLPQSAGIAIIVVAVFALLLTAVAVAAICVCRKRRQRAASKRPDPEGGSQQLEQLMAAPSNAEEEEEDEEDGEERGDGEGGVQPSFLLVSETLPKPAVAAAQQPIQDTNDPKGNERDLSLKETNDGLEEIPDGAEGATSVKDARAPTQDTDDPKGNERDLHTKDVTYGLEELTSDGDITVMTSPIGEEEEEDLYKETSV